MAKEPMPPLTEQQIDFAQMCMERYMCVRQDEGHGPPSSADVGHSALLRWLLRGNEPFPNPPPLRFSYPCYALAAGEKVMIDQPRDAHPCFERGDCNVCIDQSGAYRWIKKLPRATGIVEHKSGLLFNITIGKHDYRNADGTRGTEERYFMQKVREAGNGEQQELPALTTTPASA